MLQPAMHVSMTIAWVIVLWRPLSRLVEWKLWFVIILERNFRNCYFLTTFAVRC